MEEIERQFLKRFNALEELEGAILQVEYENVSESRVSDLERANLGHLEGGKWEDIQGVDWTMQIAPVQAYLEVKQLVSASFQSTNVVVIDE